MDIYFCTKKEGLEKHASTSWKLVMVINGLIEDSNLKYDIVNLQLGFSQGNLIYGAAEPCKFICNVAERAPELLTIRLH